MIAQEIYRQLGGRRFEVMTGARNFVSTGSGLLFRIPRSKGINSIKITLNSLDLYDIEFQRIHGATLKIVKEVNGIYNDQLQEVFERETGLYCKLF